MLHAGALTALTASILLCAEQATEKPGKDGQHTAVDGKGAAAAEAAARRERYYATLRKMAMQPGEKIPGGCPSRPMPPCDESDHPRCSSNFRLRALEEVGLCCTEPSECGVAPSLSHMAGTPFLVGWRRRYAPFCTHTSVARDRAMTCLALSLCGAETSEDISPYATFQLSDSAAAQNTLLHSFAYHEHAMTEAASPPPLVRSLRSVENVSLPP